MPIVHDFMRFFEPRVSWWNTMVGEAFDKVNWLPKADDSVLYTY